MSFMVNDCTRKIIGKNNTSNFLNVTTKIKYENTNNIFLFTY